jgi:IMP dehydrogenase/GMP reductase
LVFNNQPNHTIMQAIVMKAGTRGNNSSPVVKKEKKKKEKKSVYQLVIELIPEGKYAGLSDAILEPHELRQGK